MKFSLFKDKTKLREENAPALLFPGYVISPSYRQSLLLQRFVHAYAPFGRCACLSFPTMSILLTVLIIWTLLFIALKLFEHLTEGSLSHFLKSRNISLKFCYISFHTTRYNASIETFAQKHRSFFFYWFSFGVAFGLFGLLYSLTLLSGNVLFAMQSIIKPTDMREIQPFRPQARIPFLNSAPTPWWMPKRWWLLFTAYDHNPLGMNPRDHSMRMSEQLLMNPFREHFFHRGRRGRPCDRHDPPPFGQPRRRVMHMPGWVGRHLRRRRRHPPGHMGPPRRMGPMGRPFLPSNPNQLNHPPPRRISRQLLSVSETNSTNGNPNAAEHESRKAFLTPLVPGITIPAGDIWYMVLAILIAAVVHELGHALAAGMHNAQIEGIGGFVAVALPGAYVRLIGVEDMLPLAQLRVYCAGAWHNVMSAGIALVAVLTLPSLMSAFYATGRGALVVSVPEISPLFGHIQAGDVVVRLGRFNVTDGGESFRGAIEKLISTKDSVGFCVSEKLLGNVSTSCCGPQDHGMRECFRVAGGVMGACLNPVTVSTSQTCRSNAECFSPAAGTTINGSGERRLPVAAKQGADQHAPQIGGDVIGYPRTNRSREVCVKAELDESQQLVDVRVQLALNGDFVHFFYEGYPHMLGQSITVSSYVPRIWSKLGASGSRIVARVDIPNIVERLLQYFASISLALGLLNMAPVLFLDGEASSALFVRLLVQKLEIRAGKLKRVRAGMVGAGSALLLVNMMMAVWRMEKLT